MHYDAGVGSTARDEIAGLLATAGAGSFVSRRTGPADDLAIEIKGVGPLRLPIAREQIRRVLAKALPARYGRREATLLDRRVRDAGEIPAGEVKLDRRRWRRTLEPMLAALGTDLGLVPGQRLAAELHSLLIYGPGQFFKQHQDSERADDMVGTLVVTLPSTFTGGAIVVEHQGEIVRYGATKQPLSFVAFYADCRHEVRPVRTGYRIVLTYDLTLEGEATGPDTPPPAMVEALALRLGEHFTTPVPPAPYRSSGAPPRVPPSRLVYLLDHQYTKRGLDWRRLKGSDAPRAAALVAAAERAGCDVVLALAEVHEIRECEEPWEPDWRRPRRGSQRDEDDEWIRDDAPSADDPDAYPIGDLIDSNVTLECWMDRGGGADPILTTVRDEEVCASRASSELEPHTAEYEGYMGNYGNTMDRWYRRAALVLWPRERSFPVRAEADPSWALQRLLERIRAGELPESRRMAASLLGFWRDAVARDASSRGFALALRAAFGLESPELAAAVLEPFHLVALTSGTARPFAALAGRYGEEWTGRLLEAWTRPDPQVTTRDQAPLLSWLASLRQLVAAVRAAEGRSGLAGGAAARPLIEQGWRVLEMLISDRLDLLPPSSRERALLQLAPPILGWLSGAALASSDQPPSSDGSSIARAVSQLCGDRSAPLVPCLVRVVRLASKEPVSVLRGAPGFAALERHCSESLAASLARPPRAPGDWSLALPAGCACHLCRRLEAFLSSPREQRLEWPLAKDGRQHVHGRIDHHELPVRHETRRSGSPYALVLEKAHDLMSRDAVVRRAWQADLDWLSAASTTIRTKGSGDAGA